jgi:hypothetical protein
MANKKISQLTVAAPLTGTEELPLVQGGITLKATAQDIADLAGGGLEGTNYIYVMANGTDTDNAAELQAAYTAAQALSPSLTNRITIVCGPGNYNFDSTAFVMDTEYIDLVSLDGNRSIIFNSADPGGTIDITANDVFVKGVDVGTNTFTIGDDLSLLKVENCKGGKDSFSGVTVSGTFTNCVGGDSSFGSNGTASGTFNYCIGGDSSFGGYSGTASGLFSNCSGGRYTFGTFGTASGTFNYCTGADSSFGSGGTASGTFTNCTGGSDSFGSSGGTADGIFTNCIGGYYSFGGNGTADGTFTNCVGGDGSFGSEGTVSGTFTNCQGGEYSFGGLGTLSGKLYYCRLTFGTFQTVSGGGITRLCLDGSDVENNQG